MVHGVFDIDSFIIYFYDENSKNSEEIIDESCLFEGIYAQSNRQTYTLKPISILASNVGNNLFHELVHTWQAMSSPMIILNYLNSVKLLRRRAFQLNLYESRLSDTYPLIKDDGPEFDDIYKSHRMNFYNSISDSTLLRNINKGYFVYLKQHPSTSWLQYTDLMKYFIEKEFTTNVYEYIGKDLRVVYNFFNIIKSEKPCAIPYRHIEHEIEGKYFSCFSGLLDYFGLVNFTGDNLMEAFAYVNECVKDNVSIPIYESADSEMREYIGIFEIYRRIYSKNYISERELAISFLAVVDLAFMNDPMGDHSEEFLYYDSFRQENVSLPHRFGYLIYSLQGFRPLNYDTDKPDQSIAKWQNDICDYLGWYKPIEGVKNMIAYILAILLNDLQNYVVVDYSLIVQLFEIKSDDNNWDNIITSAVEKINRAHQIMRHKKVTMQHGVLIQIANSLFYRLKYPGRQSVPALFENQLKYQLPTTLFIYNGEYYSDYLTQDDIATITYNDVGRYSYIDQLVARSMMRFGKRQCGFLDAYIPCRYQREGFGCPTIGLAESEIIKRNRYHIPIDWCHWKCLINELDKDIKYSD